MQSNMAKPLPSGPDIKCTPTLSKKEKYKKRIEEQMLKAGSFIPAELLQELNADKQQAKNQQTIPNPWSQPNVQSTSIFLIL